MVITWNFIFLIIAQLIFNHQIKRQKNLVTTWKFLIVWLIMAQFPPLIQGLHFFIVAQKKFGRCPKSLIAKLRDHFLVAKLGCLIFLTNTQITQGILLIINHKFKLSNWWWLDFHRWSNNSKISIIAPKKKHLVAIWKKNSKFFAFVVWLWWLNIILVTTRFRLTKWCKYWLPLIFP